MRLRPGVWATRRNNIRHVSLSERSLHNAFRFQMGALDCFSSACCNSTSSTRQVRCELNKPLQAHSLTELAPQRNGVHKGAQRPSEKLNYKFTKSKVKALQCGRTHMRDPSFHTLLCPRNPTLPGNIRSPEKKKRLRQHEKNTCGEKVTRRRKKK